MINSRSLSDLLPEAATAFEHWRLQAEDAGLIYGVHWIVTSTYRDQEMQDALYAKGRTSFPGRIVTWTRHSRHTSRRAWDILIITHRDGKQVACWDVVKTDVDADGIPDYAEMADIGRKCGLIVGADYGDWPHYEVPKHD